MTKNNKGQIGITLDEYFKMRSNKEITEIPGVEKENTNNYEEIGVDNFWTQYYIIK